MRSKPLYIIGGVVLVTLAIIVLWCFGLNQDVSEDSLKFKRDYEAYNEQSTYEKVAIEKSNKAKYIELEEAIDILNKNTALVFIGIPSDRESRLIAEKLVVLTEKSELESFMYLDATKLISEYKLKGQELYKTNETSEEYNELINILDKYLDTYKLEKNGKIYESEEKILGVPMLIAVTKGNIGTVLTKSFEDTQLENIIDEVINKTTTCDETC